MDVVPYSPQYEASWDEFCARAVNAPFLHTRRFLGYHGGRFQDLSLILREEGSIVGVLPAAALPGTDGAVASHPGATYGGLVHDGWLSGGCPVGC